jgi:hypothetical protein
VLPFLLFFAGISAGQDQPDQPRNRSKSESPPFFSDVTIWTAQTDGSVNVMSTCPGQEIIMRWNFEIIPVCMPSFPTANGRNMHTVKNNPGFDGILMYAWGTRQF